MRKKQTALGFVILLGLVSLFSDITHEGARSIMGPFFAMLGASGAAVGIVAGFGEFIGYGLRFFSGWLVDYSKQYWHLMLLGYSINLFAIPALALVGHWQVAALLMILERTGKAIRTPARDTILSYATQKLGMGWGFGIHQAIDQMGALLGPLLVAVILYLHGQYRLCFLILFIPAAIAVAMLLFSKQIYLNSEAEENEKLIISTKKIPPTFWLYVVANMFIALGYADFSIIAFHFVKDAIIPSFYIPALYAVAMGMSAIAAITLGRLYDHHGLIVLVIATLMSILFAPCVFWGNANLALLGMMLWGIGMGTQRSLIKAIIGNMITENKRGFAYGIFNAFFGLAWFIGSSIIGILYDHSIHGVVVFSVLSQLIGLFLFVVLMINMRNKFAY